jgi:competence protein ComEA
MLKTIIIGLVVTIIGLFALSAVDKVTSGWKSSSSVNGYTTSQVDDANTLKVAISGEINHPGDYYVVASDTLGSLIIQAGGVTSKADTKAYNESLVINTHTSFYIPPVSETPSSCIETEISKTNINTADAASLKTTGFTDSQATNLVDYRNTNGNFEALEDIMNVKGIGLATFNKVKNKITLD